MGTIPSQQAASDPRIMSFLGEERNGVPQTGFSVKNLQQAACLSNPSWNLREKTAFLCISSD